ncbi:sugar phosphate isomerase/epimerase [Candidatus Sumerlaeota bacterium]|nr:sugar phosphate isomerase/epimerase [Candidatus Sumerlaeota bacterium]
MEPMAVGVFTHSLRPSNPDELFELLQRLGLKVIQLSLIDPAWREPAIVNWLERLLGSSGVEAQTSFFGFPDEDYSTIARIRQTGGFVVDFEQRLAVVRDIIKISKRLGIKAVAGHAGFVPEDREDPQYALMIQRIGTVADEANAEGLELLLETGQETAEGLLQVLSDLGRRNVRINFDPANILLYGVGKPVEAARKLGPHIASVHAKDATASGRRDEWGIEKLLGEGAVNYPRLLETLRDGGFRGPLAIECEIPNVDAVKAVTHARDRLRYWLSQLAR